MTESERYSLVQKALGNFPYDDETTLLPVLGDVWRAAVDCYQAIEVDY